MEKLVDFLNGKVNLVCNNRIEAQKLIDVLDSMGVLWINGRYLSEWNMDFFYNMIERRNKQNTYAFKMVNGEFSFNLYNDEYKKEDFTHINFVDIADVLEEYASAYIQIIADKLNKIHRDILLY